MKTKQWKQPMWILTAVVVLVGVFDLARPALAFPTTMAGLAASMLEPLAKFFGQALLVVVQYVITFSGFNNFIDAPVVQTGWVLTRDIANMFYVFVFLLIAFGTMLKSEEYNWKKLLPRLVLTALMVNFSRLIIGLLIDFSQVIMLTFVNGFAATGGGNFLQAFHIQDVFSIVNRPGPPADDLDTGQMIGFLLAAILLGMAMVVTAVFAVILLARIVALWVLIVLSPLAFLLGTFPKGKTYYDEWWKKLTNQIIVGPVLAFFLWLSLATVGSGTAFETIADPTTNPTYRADVAQNTKINASFPSIGTTKIGDFVALGDYLVSIAILFSGLLVTQQLGVVGSGLAGGAASWMKSKATSVAKKAAIVAGVAAAPGGLGLAAKFGLGLGAEKLGALGAGAAYKFAKEGVTNRVAGWWDKRKTMAMKGEGLGAGVIRGVIGFGLKSKAYRQTWEHKYEEKVKPKEAEYEEKVYEKIQGWAPPLKQNAEASLQAEKAKKYAQIDNPDSFGVVADELAEAMDQAQAEKDEFKIDSLRHEIGALFLMGSDKGFNDDYLGRYYQNKENEILNKHGVTSTSINQAKNKAADQAVTELGKNETYQKANPQEKKTMELKERAKAENEAEDDIRGAVARGEWTTLSKKFDIKVAEPNREALLKDFAAVTVEHFNGEVNEDGTLKVEKTAASNSTNGANTRLKYINDVILGGGSEKDVNKAAGKMQGFLSLLPTDEAKADVAFLSKEVRTKDPKTRKTVSAYQLNTWQEVENRKAVAANKVEDSQRIKFRPHFEHSISARGRITGTNNDLAAAKRGGLQQRNANESTRSATAMFLRTTDPKEIAFRREQNVKMGALVTTLRELPHFLANLLDKTQVATNTNSLNKVGVSINSDGREITSGTMQLVVDGRSMKLADLKEKLGEKPLTERNIETAFRDVGPTTEPSPQPGEKKK